MTRSKRKEKTIQLSSMPEISFAQISLSITLYFYRKVLKALFTKKNTKKSVVS